MKTALFAACLLGLALILSGCVGGGASLSVEGLNGEDHIGLSQGCYTTVSGVVMNNGGSAAEDVEVSCSTTQQGVVFATESKTIGAVSAGSERSFSVDVDTDCLKGAVTYNCTADCGNC